MQGTARLSNLLCELGNTAHAIDDLRVDCITDHKFDPAGDGFFLHLEESDNCDPDDDDDRLYVEMRKRLYAFQLEENKKYLCTEPVWNRTLRKDIRAWARLARYDCVKLSCQSMLIHKDKGKLPQRPRFKPKDFSALLEQRILAAKDVTNNISDEDESFVYDESTEDIWQPRQSKAGYLSAGSNASSASMWSNKSKTKKRRLPRADGAYECDSPGCGKSYDRQCHLTHHQRSHRPKDSLPFACEQCEKRFGFAKDLKRHQKTHVGR